MIHLHQEYTNIASGEIYIPIEIAPFKSGAQWVNAVIYKNAKRETFIRLEHDFNAKFIKK